MANPAIIPGWSGILGWKAFGQEVEGIVVSEKEAGRTERARRERSAFRREKRLGEKAAAAARCCAGFGSRGWISGPVFGIRGHRASFAGSHTRDAHTRVDVDGLEPADAGGGLPMAPAIFHN